MAKKKRNSDTQAHPKDGQELPFMDPELGYDTPGFREWLSRHPERKPGDVVNEILKNGGYPHA